MAVCGAVASRYALALPQKGLTRGTRDRLGLGLAAGCD